MRIRELIQKTNTTERQVRYLISEGFMPGPVGGRANAEYDDNHVRIIQRYSRLRELGFPPAAIKLLLNARDGTPFPIDDGITLLVSPDLLASGTPVAPLIQKIEQILVEILKEDGHDHEG